MHVTLEAEDPETFFRFAQYLYTRDYTDPASSIDLAAGSWEDHHDCAVVQRQPMPILSSRAAETLVASSVTGFLVVYGALEEDAEAWEKSTSKVFPMIDPVKAMGQCSSPHANYSPVLMGHAKVYIFAEKYEIEGLADLAMKKLHMALCTFQLYSERIADISKLLRFVHLNISDAEDPLRALVMEYAVCVIMELVEDPALLVKGPPSLDVEFFFPGRQGI